MSKLFNKIKTYISPFLNWRILIIYLPIWFIMSGWTYLFIYLGTRHHISWMLAAGTFWATVLWLPITPEKLITIPLTLLIYIRVFGRGNKDTVSGQLQREKLEAMVLEARGDWRNTKTWFNKNYSKLVKTMTIILATLLILFGLLILCG